MLVNALEQVQPLELRAGALVCEVVLSNFVLCHARCLHCASPHLKRNAGLERGCVGATYGPSAAARVASL